MANLRLGYLNYADLATITATPTLSPLSPPGYLKTNARGDLAIATSNASQAIFLTWGGLTVSANEVAFWRANFAAADTIRVQHYSDAAWTTQIHDSTALAAYSAGLFTAWGWSYYKYYHALLSNIKSTKITIAAASAFQASRLFVGLYGEVPINPVYGAVVAPDTNSINSRSFGGSLRNLRRADWRTMSFDMSVQTEADRAIWFEVSRYCSNVGVVLADLYPGVGGVQERDHTIMGCFEKPPAQKLAGGNKWDFSMKILEL
jgi:hypothetical protein